GNPLVNVRDATSRLGMGDEAEGEIAVNPKNPMQLFMASNTNSNATGLVISFSIDGGNIWTPRLILTGAVPTPPTDLDFVTGAALPTAFTDPSVAWDEFGNLFLAYLDNAAPRNAVLLRSTNGGQSFALVNTWPARDQPKVTVGSKSVWLVWNNGAN